MARHTIHHDLAGFSDGTTLSVAGDEAAHAVKSRRLRAGDRVDVTDGAGTVLTCLVTNARKAELTLEVESSRTVERPTPAVRLYTATPKGPRLDKMIDMVSQAGAASWRAMDTKLGVVDPGAKKLDRARRISVESAKQCGRAWVMEIGESAPFAEAIEPAPGRRVLLAHAGGGARPEVSPGDDEVRLLVGPEGGFTPEELDAADRAGAQRLDLGPHTLRIETAAVVGAALVALAARAG